MHDALPPVEGFVPNPVLANLERAFNADPRRHKRNDSQVSQLSKLSQLSISSLSRCGTCTRGCASVAVAKHAYLLVLDGVVVKLA
jgi:hypothetical protein